MDLTKIYNSSGDGNNKLLRLVIVVSFICALVILARLIAMFAYPYGLRAYDRGEFDIALPIFYSGAAFNDPAAAAMVGTMHLRGQGVEKDGERAEYWLTRAATADFALAQSVLGIMYATGQGVPRDVAKAQLWLSRAAGAGDKEAEALLRRLVAGKAI